MKTVELLVDSVGYKIPHIHASQEQYPSFTGFSTKAKIVINASALAGEWGRVSIVSLTPGGDSPVQIVATPSSNTGCKVIMQRPVALEYQPLSGIVTHRDDIITRSSGIE